MNNFVHFITRRIPAILIALVIPLFAMGLAGMLGEASTQRGPGYQLPDGTESQKVALMRAELPQSEGSTAVVVYSSADGKAFPKDVQGQLSAVEIPDAISPPIPAEDGTAIMRVVQISTNGLVENEQAVKDLRAAVREGLPEGVEVGVTGPAAIQADLAGVFDGANMRLLLVTAAVVALLLVVTYRSPILWIIPLLIVAVADRFAAVMASWVLKGVGMVSDPSTTGILSVLVFGAGTNYALLLISRYRDELRRHEDRREAMRIALPRAAAAVIPSATTVILGVLTLLLSAFPATRSLGLSCAVGILIAALFALIVLPAALVVPGRWVFWPKVPSVGEETQADSESSIWARIGNAVSRRPVAVIVGALALLAAMAAGILRMDVGLSDADQFLRKPEAISAAERLGESFPAGAADPVRIITREDPEKVIAHLKTLEPVVSAQPGASADGVSEISVVIDAASGSDEGRAAIDTLRGRGPVEYFTGGSEAEGIDIYDQSVQDQWRIFPVVLLLVAGALILLLRSLWGSLILVTTVVGTFAASLGFSWWLFTGVFGFNALDSTVPLYAFVFLVALGVDYNIFLVTRAKEEAAGRSTAAGVKRGLTATGGVITSAGILLAAVFAVLGVLPLVVLAQVGAVVCVGVLLDTLLVRTLLVPAIMFVMKDRFWWPSHPDRLTPVGVAHDSAAGQ